jgi:hypothetical protein
MNKICVGLDKETPKKPNLYKIIFPPNSFLCASAPLRE